MRRSIEVLFTLLFTLVPASSVYAGASCFDACTGPVGQVACGSIGLGCPPGGGQCIQCRDNNDCQPGGTCDSGVCLGLPCGPDAGMSIDSGLVDSGLEDSGLVDSGLEDGGMCACDTTPKCNPGCNCDFGCVRCACDVTYQCDPGCGCDIECPADGGSVDVGSTDASPAADATFSPDARSTGGGAGAGTTDRSGCGCTTTDTTAIAPVTLLAFLLVLRRRPRA